METTEAFYEHARERMVEQQLRRRGIRDARVLEAMGRVPRHLFVSESLRREAYEDHPLPIGYGQTISQPYMVARMVELCALQPTDRVLEVGAGCGYQTAVLARLCARVDAIEIVPELATLARTNLQKAGVRNARVEHGDGSQGWPDKELRDAIVVAAGAPRIPEPLQQQLADGGRLVIPVGDEDRQILLCLRRQGDRWLREEDTGCRFVHLRGACGWDA